MSLRIGQPIRGVFASHYDESRIVSQSAPDEALQQLDQASIAAYDEIEQESGIRFFTPSGRLTALPQDEPAIYPYLSPTVAHCRSVLDGKFPFQFPADYSVVFEAAPSGYLNPRKMVQAQVAVAQKLGAEVVAGLVTQVTDRETHVDIVLDDGRVISAEKILIATGAFANCFDLLKQKLAIKAETLTSVLCEVSAETATAFTHLPPLNYLETDSPIQHISILPPLAYPDGRSYMKLALTSLADTLLPDFAAASDWFRNTRTFPYLNHVKTLMAKLLPQIEVLSWRVKPCIAAYTPTFKPMIDCLVDGRIYVAVGGNGGSAHSSDAIGKLAADLMLHNRWLSPLDHTPFRLQYADEWHDWMMDRRSVWHTR